MFAANLYPVRFATEDDAGTLKRLAERDSQQPLDGRVLVGHLDGRPAAALSLDDGRVIADRSRRTDRLVAFMRMRAGAIRAYEATPSLADRLRAEFASYGSGSVVTPAWTSSDGHDAEQEPVRVAA